jgi:protein phosphatase
MTTPFLEPDKHYAGQRIQGKRNYQEDDFGFDNQIPSDFIMMVADGLGGHQGGAHASHCVVQSFLKHYRTSSGTVAQRLQKALEQANLQLAKDAEDNSKLYGMGCTLVAVVFHDHQIEWISVGDSPLWLYDSQVDQLHRLNLDHSMKVLLQERVHRGELTPAEAERHPERNLLFSALTAGNPIELVDTSPEPLTLLEGDRILLASDGIFTLSDEEIANILRGDLTAQQFVDELLMAVEAKNQRNQDNTTVLVVKIETGR